MESYKGAVHSAKDAIILLEASRINKIPRVTRRLKEDERASIKAGDVFIWNEKEAKMRRWTDGRSWSASRVTGSFLTYREMESNSDSKVNENIHHSNYTYKANGLIKQSFSLTTLKGDKLHLISYTTTDNYTNSKFLNKTPSTDPIFNEIKIPKEIYPELNESSNSSSEKSPKPSSTSIHSSPSIAPSVNQISPLPSPITLESRATLSKAHIPRNIEQQSIQQINLPQLPPLSYNAPKRFSSPNTACYDSVALNALDRLSFKF